jgi:hypothetical protein
MKELIGFFKVKTNLFSFVGPAVNATTVFRCPDVRWEIVISHSSAIVNQDGPDDCATNVS